MWICPVRTGPSDLQQVLAEGNGDGFRAVRRAPPSLVCRRHAGIVAKNRPTVPRARPWRGVSDSRTVVGADVLGGPPRARGVRQPSGGRGRRPRRPAPCAGCPTAERGAGRARGTRAPTNVGARVSGPVRTPRAEAARVHRAPGRVGARSDAPRRGRNGGRGRRPRRPAPCAGCPTAERGAGRARGTRAPTNVGARVSGPVRTPRAEGGAGTSCLSSSIIPK